MKFKIPFTFSSINALKKRSQSYTNYVKYRKNTKLSENLEHCQVDLTRKDYVAIGLRSFTHFFVFMMIISTTILGFLEVPYYYLVGAGVSVFIAGFIFISQMSYPKMHVMRRQKNIDKNLLSALEDILVQLNSGIPLFSVMVNISAAGYGELSSEFRKAVHRINAGSPEQEVLEDLSKRNPSPYFKRTLWQISNGMNAGSDMSIVVKDSMRALTEEQNIQIQNYGNKLNPLMVFYMLAAVIVPALSITFLTILSSMINLPKSTTQYMFMCLLVLVLFVQIMFLGIIKSRRPSLL